jgi:hypothetical protein
MADPHREWVAEGQHQRDADGEAVTQPKTHATDRVAVISFTEEPSNRLKKHVHFLISRGIHVTVVSTTSASWEEFRTVPHLQVTPMRQYEYRHPLNRSEYLLVDVVPGKIMSLAERATETRLGRPLRNPIKSGHRMQRKLSRVVHYRIYNKLYQLVRPRVLSKIARNKLDGLRRTRFHRIIAGDTTAFTLGWHLARLNPEAIATTSLDEDPYADLPVLPNIPHPVLRTDE